ncbi:TlpA family protein disulfide reductase [Ornithinimicrobium sp. Y1694]|uniref:TlpA family protein disulfide reductase n=1 Tax=Ornithinimicrobium sp. Y1694 TaxID=3418590 RepID=UPI003CF6453B
MTRVGVRASTTARGCARRGLPWLAALAASTLVLAGCSDDGTSINAQMREGDQKGYVAGDGTIEQLDPEQRDIEISLAGTTLTDEPWDAADHTGEVLVVNVWGSWCGPCVEETPDLVEVSSAYADAGEPVRFIGVNVRDSVPNATSFADTYGMPYESLADDGGRTRAQLGGLGIATPSTIVVDPEGFVAARVSGPVDAATLRGLIEDVLAEDAAGATG